MSEGDAEVPLADLGELVTPLRERVKPSSLPANTPYLSLENIEPWRHEVMGAGKASDVRSATTPFQEGDVLYGRMRPYLNKVCVAPFDGICSTEIFVLRSPYELDAAYLVRFLGQPAVVDYATHHSTGDLPRIAFSRLAQLRIPLPGSAEQRRIVARVDRTGLLVNQARSRIEQSAGLMQQAERSLLAKACSGDLTADYRGEDSGPPSQGEGPFELPAGWEWVRLDELLRENTRISYGILKPGDPDPSGVSMLRVVDIGDGEIKPDAVVRVSPELAAEYKRSELEEGDIVLAVMATIGRAAVVPASFIGANVNRALAVIKPSAAIESEYLLSVMLSPFFQDAFADRKLGSSQSRINLGDLRTFPMPLPPLPEQQEIIRRVERWRQMAGTVAEHIRRADGLVDQSFRGAAVQIFRTTPTGEPARY